MQAAGFTITNQVYVPERLKPDCLFEQRYIDLRRREQRVYTDNELRQLPDISRDHVHFEEWQVRKRSAQRLVGYLEKKDAPQRILEVGCGNGWLSRKLASIPGSRVIGTDINFTELQQAARVFSEVPNLLFIYADVESDILGKMEFDCIVFASCIQYFDTLAITLEQSMQLLRPAGEVHILDSPFYKPGEKAAAIKRTAAYYREMGFDGMTRHYFHHTLDELNDLHPDFLYRPSPLQQYFGMNRNPFPWIRIKKTAMIK